MPYENILEEELKNKVAHDYFEVYDCTQIIGKVDFCVAVPNTNKKQKNLFKTESLLWAEAKKGKIDIYTSLVQLILTIGKAKTFNTHLPPAFLGAFDAEKIAFIPYNDIHDIFYQTDFNWNVASSNQKTKEFKQVHDKVKTTLESGTYHYFFRKDDKELNAFIKANFVVGKSEVSKIKIDKNNFIPIYLRWLEEVKPLINFDWTEGKKQNFLDSDFYLADLFVDDHGTSTIDDDTPLKNNLFVVFSNQQYNITKENLKQLYDASISISNKNQYEQFWKKYKRPPIEEFQQYIIARRDLLVPQDIRERKGAFFTPRIWVELSQKYIADTLGENWQEEYYVWDCAAGTGNLLTGLTNKYNIYASTLDQADVSVMHDRIKHGANLLENHVFQFDFLNDDFTKLPQSLQTIINDPKKRKKLVIYINPPYAEADNRKGEGRTGVAETLIHKKYSSLMGYTRREMYIQFLTRIYCEISGAVLADFSKLKNLQAPKFIDFRIFFRAKLEKLFLVPADTFDNVTGQFPIGFFIWNTSIKENFEHISADVYDEKENFITKKNIWAYDDTKFINDWVKTFRYSKSESIATIIGVGSDFQNQRLVRFGEPHMKVPASNHNWQITQANLIESSVYYTVRHSIEGTWLNDRDQFLYPNDGWEKDTDFQNDCLAYTLFNNNIQSKYGTNNWIPFTEYEVGSREKFESHFMTDFIAGRAENNIVAEPSLFDKSKPSRITPLIFSAQAKEVFNAGKKLWQYYHSQQFPSTGGLRSGYNVNASLYDIREYFQGRNDKGKMNNKSQDETYQQLIINLRSQLKLLAAQIEPKIYEYGFLKA